MLVTHFVWRYRGRQTLKSVGRNPYLAGAGDGATERTLRRLQNSAESKRLTYYSFTNAAALTVRTAEVPAVTISFAAIEDTSAIFLAQLTADAEPDDAALTLTVHYYLNDQQIENFTPQQRMEQAPTRWRFFTRLQMSRQTPSSGCRYGWSAAAARCGWRGTASRPP